MLRTIALVLMLCFFVSIIVPFCFAGEINWLNSMNEGLNAAKAKNKPIMVDFYTDWCGWGKKLDKDTYSNAKVQGLADKFVCVKVDGDKDKANVSKYRIDGYPTILFLDSTGKEIDRNVGYAGPEAFAKKLEQIAK